MGRRRLIGDEVLGSADLLPLPASGRLLWIGLLIIADSDGYVRNDLRYLKNRILPETRTRLASIAQWLDHYRARDMTETCTRRVRDQHETSTSDDVSYIRIKNFKSYHNLKCARDDWTRTRTGQGVDNAPPPPPKKPPAKRPEPDPAMEFFLEKMSCPASRLPDAQNAVKKHAYDFNDLRDWQEALDAAQAILALPEGPLRSKLPGDPVAWLRNRMLANKNPRTAGISWWQPKQKTNSVKQKAIAQLQKRVGETLKINGDSWDVEQKGLHNPEKGSWLFSQMSEEQLENVANALEGAINRE